MLQAFLSLPFGYEFQSEQLIEDSSEQRILICLDLRWAEGWSYDHMANELNPKNLPTKRNRKWYGSVINRILKLSYTCRFITDNGEDLPPKNRSSY